MITTPESKCRARVVSDIATVIAALAVATTILLSLMPHLQRPPADRIFGPMKVLSSEARSVKIAPLFQGHQILDDQGQYDIPLSSAPGVNPHEGEQFWIRLSPDGSVSLCELSSPKTCRIASGRVPNSLQKLLAQFAVEEPRRDD